jgi:hypothetical protein
MSEGWIKLHRSIKDNFLWKSEKFSKSQAWIDLILSANHSDGGFYLRGIWIEVKRGQSARSELTLSKEWKWSRDKVRRFLTRLKNEQMITVKQDNKTSIITICNYEIYQGDEKENDTPDNTTNDTPEKHQKNTKQDTNKNVKNEDNVKKEYSENSIEYRLSLFLLNNIRKRKPDYKIPDLQKWSIQSDYILRIDKRDIEEVKKVISWCQNDEFWQDNILSTSKLRKQYDKLVLKMNKNTIVNKLETVSHPSHREL